MFNKALGLLALLPLSAAHFTLNWPTARGFSESSAGNFPCGGFDSVKTPRTPWPKNGGPVQLKMEHSQTNVEVLLAVGDTPGNNYNIVLRQTFSIEGLGNFCVGQVSLPNGVNISDGTPATLQVVSNGDPNGGLYQCADVTLTSSIATSDYNSHCTNQTGWKVVAENIQGNPNETTTSPSQSQSGGAASATKTGLASHPTAASWAAGAIGLAGLALL